MDRRLILPILVVLAGFPLGTLAAVGGQQGTLPRFEDLPVGQIYSGPPAPVNPTSAPGARTFRTVLRKGARNGPNFAGHYTVVIWGCGSNCQQFAILNARTGRVYMGEFALAVGASYRLDSKLFIANPREHWEDSFGGLAAEAFGGYATAEYYRWNGAALIKLATLAIGKNVDR